VNTLHALLQYLYYIQVMKLPTGADLSRVGEPVLASTNTPSASASAPTPGNPHKPESRLLTVDIDRTIATSSTPLVDTGVGDNVGGQSSWVTVTKPGTHERRAVYVRTTHVHLFCVHVLANALALTIIIGGQKERKG
jgi:hypothetical protein